MASLSLHGIERRHKCLEPIGYIVSRTMVGSEMMCLKLDPLWPVHRWPADTRISGEALPNRTRSAAGHTLAIPMAHPKDGMCWG